MNPSLLPRSDVLVAPAVVARVHEDGQLDVHGPDLGERAARPAVVGGWDPRRGDRVLVLSDAHGRCFVVGVLSALREAEPQPADGWAIDGWAIEQRGRVTRLVAPEDLELVAPRGRVTVRAARGVQIDSETDVGVRARRRVDVASHDGERDRSALRLDGDAAELKAGVLATRAARLVVLAEEVSAVATRLDARLEQVRQRATRIETEAQALIERTKSSYREVEGLAQTRAGELRWVARGALSALADRAKLKAKRIFAIDGEAIHLG